MHSAIIFALIWSFGGVYEEPARPKFHEYIVCLIRGQNTVQQFNLDSPIEPLKLKVKLTDELLKDVFKSSFQKSEKVWVNWMLTDKEFKVPLGGVMQVI